MSADTGIPLVVTNDSHYLRTTMCAPTKFCFASRPAKQCRIRTVCASNTGFPCEDARGDVKLFGEVEHAMDRTYDIAQRCHVKLEKVKEPFPRFEVPENQTLDSYFGYVAREGFEKRRHRLEALRQQAG